MYRLIVGDGSLSLYNKEWEIEKAKSQKQERIKTL
jgi:hypothetical protein